MRNAELLVNEPTARDRRRRYVAWGVFGVACLSSASTAILLNHHHRAAMSRLAALEARLQQRTAALDRAWSRIANDPAPLEKSWESLQATYPELQRSRDPRQDKNFQQFVPYGESQEILAIFDPVTGSRYGLSRRPGGFSSFTSHQPGTPPPGSPGWQTAQAVRGKVKSIAPLLYALLLIGFARCQWRRLCADLLLATSIIFALAVLTNLVTPTRVECIWTGVLLSSSIGLMAMAWKPPKIGYYPRCTECGYNLTGNVSGICPECGTAIPGRHSARGNHRSTQMDADEKRNPTFEV